VPSVCVLLATKNGAEFIEDFLISLVAQDCEISEVIVSDDGSTDATLEIVRRVLNGILKYQILYGPQLGSTQNFFSALKKAPKYDFYAFADQDDKWARDHISRAINAPQLDITIPAMAFSSTTKKENFSGNRSALVLSSAKLFLLHNWARGCTFVFNSAARDALLMQNTSSVKYHDWFTLLTVGTVGKIYQFNTASVYYREHAGQQIGSQRNLAAYYRKLKRFPDSIHESMQMCQIIIHSSQLDTSEMLEILELWVDYQKIPRWNLILRVNRLRMIKPNGFSTLRTYYGYLGLLVYSSVAYPI